MLLIYTMNISKRRLILITLFGLIAVVLMLVAGCGTGQHVNETITWKPYADIQATFPANSRPTMLFISQDNCHFCHKMKDTIFTRPEIAWFISQNFDVVEINVDRDMPITVGGQKYDYHPFHDLLSIQGIPCYYWFSADGQIIGMLHGAQNVLDMKRILQYTVNGHFGKTPYAKWLQTDEAKLDTLYGYW